MPLAKIGALVASGKRLKDLGVEERQPSLVSVKVPVFPFLKFKEADTILTPEMRSTGEVMGLAPTFGEAFKLGLEAADIQLPQEGMIFVSVRDDDKEGVMPVLDRLQALGFSFIGTRGTAQAMQRHGIACAHVNKVKEGRPHIVDRLVNGDVVMVINTTVGAQSIRDSFSIRRTALTRRIPYFTTIFGAMAAASAIESSRAGTSAEKAISLQDCHRLPPLQRGASDRAPVEGYRSASNAPE